MHIRPIAIAAVCGLIAGASALAQVGRGGSEWLTALGDAQRSSWIRTDAKISVETMSQPGFELQWTSRLANQPRRLNGLTQGVTANGVTLFVPMSVVAGSSNNVFALDNDTGYVVWQRRFDARMPAPTAACPGGVVSAATRIVDVAPKVAAPPARAGGPAGARGAVGYRSVLGEPGEGVPLEARRGGPPRAAGPAPGAGAAPRGAGAPAAPLPPAPGPGRADVPPLGIPGAPASAAAGGLGRPSGVVYIVSSDGVLHVLGLPSGKDIQRPAPFLPPNAYWSDAIAVGTMLYAATSRNCGGAPSAIWAIDLESEAKPVVSWKTNGGAVVSRVAFATDGTLVAAIGSGTTAGDGKANAIVTLDAKTLQIKDWFSQPTAEFVTGPTIFRHGARDIIGAVTKDGRVVLLDAASPGGADHSTPLFVSRSLLGAGGTVAADAIASWEQTASAPAAGLPGAVPSAPAGAPGVRWILVPIGGLLPAGAPGTNGTVSTGAVVALKLLESSGAFTLEPEWTSHNLVASATPIVVNGVVFALSTGRPAAPAGRGTPAVLYAYDGATGHSLWSSQKSMTTFASPGSFWSAMGQMYVGTHDGTVYAFGVLDERR